MGEKPNTNLNNKQPKANVILFYAYTIYFILYCYEFLSTYNKYPTTLNSHLLSYPITIFLGVIFVYFRLYCK